MLIINYNIHANQYKVNKSLLFYKKNSIVNYNIYAHQYNV
jgi:hypothetical protein